MVMSPRMIELAPRIHTANKMGDVVFGYSSEDRIASQKQGAVQSDYTFDSLGRRYQDKLGTSVKTVRHYMDETDFPSWATGTGTAAGQTVVYDEYGVPQSPELDNRPIGLGVDKRIDTTQLFALTYGSLGQPQRETTDTGIQFMGARGYNPITGQFLSPDPVQDGNETPYNYPNDPINKLDISGALGLAAGIALNAVLSTAAWALTVAGCVGLGPMCLLLAGALLAGGAGALSAGIESSLDGDDPKITAEKAKNGFISGAVSRGAGLGARMITRASGSIIKKSATLRLNINPQRVGRAVDKTISTWSYAKTSLVAVNNFGKTRDILRSFVY
jgi:RHS repeat-associated protein